MAIRAITFDFWRTLFADRVEPVERRQIRIDALCRATGVQPENAKQALLTSEYEFLQHHIKEQRTLSPMDAVHIVARELRVEIAADTAAYLAEVFGTAILAFPPVPIPDGLDAVRYASERFPIGIISDSGISPGKSLRTILERNGYAPYFGHMSFSDEIGVAKPQALMFESAARGLGVDVCEILHIGDLEGTDIQGAKRAGARAALFVGDHDRYRDHNTADYVLENWAHFVEMFPSLS